MTVVAIMQGCCRSGEAMTPDSLERIAASMIGAMVSSTILTLTVIPAVYAFVKDFNPERQPQAAPAMVE